jgi:hypothetical protein
MKIPAYDPENLIPEQYSALLAFSAPISFALIAGIPTEAVLKHVTNVLQKTKDRRPEIK